MKSHSDWINQAIRGEIMLQFERKSSTNDAGPRVLETLATPRHNRSDEGDPAMPLEHISGDSVAKVNTHPPKNWKSIGGLARELAEKAAGKP